MNGPRALALQVLTTWERGRRPVDELLHAALAASQLAPRDRALVTNLVLGVLRHRAALDFLLHTLRDGPVDAAARQVLRLGLYQLLHTRIPAHAAVGETVALAGRARPLANAVLRRAAREMAALRKTLAAAPREVRWSHPSFLLARWEARYGAQAVAQLCAWNNTPAPLYIRINPLRAAPDAPPFDSLPTAGHPPHPLVRQVKTTPLDWIARGLCYVQDPSTLLACDLLAPPPGSRVLDACAAPGGKTSYLAALMQNRGEIVATDVAPARLQRLRENLERLGATIARVVRHDWEHGTGSFASAAFDAILLDAPCTNTGVMRRRVDVRWRLRARDFRVLPARQLAIARALVPLLRPGGTLVFSTCSLEPEENEQVVERLVATCPDLRLVGTRVALPFRDGMDGAFAARLEREQ